MSPCAEDRPFASSADRYGAWTLESPLGSGGFGAVWRARSRWGGVGALKLIDEPPGDELRALASVVHRSIPAVLDAGTEPCPYLVMELARGRTLRAMLRMQRAPEEALVQVW